MCAGAKATRERGVVIPSGPRSLRAIFPCSACPLQPTTCTSQSSLGAGIRPGHGTRSASHLSGCLATHHSATLSLLAARPSASARMPACQGTHVSTSRGFSVGDRPRRRTACPPRFPDFWHPSARCSRDRAAHAEARDVCWCQTPFTCCKLRCNGASDVRGGVHTPHGTRLGLRGRCSPQEAIDKKPFGSEAGRRRGGRQAVISRRARTGRTASISASERLTLLT